MLQLCTSTDGTCWCDWITLEAGAAWIEAVRLRESGLHVRVRNVAGQIIA